MTAFDELVALRDELGEEAAEWRDVGDPNAGWVTKLHERIDSAIGALTGAPMASPYNYSSGDEIHFCFRPQATGSPARTQVKTPSGAQLLWHNESGIFRDWITEDGKRIGFVVDWGPWRTGRILLDDVLFIAEPAKVQPARFAPPASGAPKPPNGKRVSLK